VVTSTGAGPLQRAGEERSCSAGITAFGDQDVDDLAVLVDRAVEVRPAAGDLDVGLVDKPAVAHGVPCRAGSINELRGEGLYPAIHRDVIDPDATFGQQLFHVAIGQAVAQIPAHRDRDHLP